MTEWIDENHREHSMNSTPLWYMVMKRFQKEGMYTNLTIPFLLGIYKMDERIYDFSSPQCIKDFLEEVIRTFPDEEVPSIFKCDNICEWVISTQNDKNHYKLLPNASGRSIFINSELMNIPEPTIDNISAYFWNTYSYCFQNAHFSKKKYDWGDYSVEEKKIIAEILNPSILNK